MKTVIICWTIMLSFVAQSSAQRVFISGHVYDVSGEPIPGANVTIDKNGGTSTDIMGHYKLEVSPGNYTLSITHVGYEKAKKNITLGTINAEHNFRMSPASIQLSDIVITANEQENIQRIADYDIQLRPVKNSQEILRMIPGLFIAQHGGGGKAEQIFLRGFDIDHGTDINLSVDGLPVNMVSHAHGQGYSDLHFLIPETIKGIEFNKGPYQADKGDFTTAGYAAFKTYDQLENSEIKMETGQFGTFRTVAMIDLLKNRKEKESAYFASEILLSDGYFESDQNFSRLNFMGRYNRMLTDNTKLTLSFSNFRSTWTASGQIPERAINSGLITRFGAIDDTEGGKTGRTNISAKLINNLNNGASLTNQLYAIGYDFRLISNFTFFLNDSINGDQITQSEKRKVIGYKNEYAVDKYLGNWLFTSEWGTDIRHDYIKDIRLSNTLNGDIILRDRSRGDVNQTNASIWTSQTFALDQKFSVNAGIRFDYFNFVYDDRLSQNKRSQEQESITSPKVQLNYKIDRKINLFAKAGIGFHSNDTRVAVEQKGRQILPKAKALDIGAIYKPTQNIVVNTALWTLKLDQEFVYVGDEGIVEPSGMTRRSGFDLSLRYQINKQLFLDTDFTYTHAKSLHVAEEDNHIPLAPAITSIGGLTYKTKNGWTASLRYRYLGDRPANEGYSVTAEGYFLMDAAINYQHPKFHIIMSAENILDRAWKEAQFLTESRLANESNEVSEIHFTPGTPRFIKVGVSFLF